MTEASKGLRQALARGASGSVVALAEMSIEDIMAGLSDDQKASLQAAAAPVMNTANAAGDPEPDPNDPNEPGEGEKCSKCSEPMKDGKCQKCSPDSSASASAADGVALQSNASIHERVKAVATAVASDESCKGKADLALAMLADDDFASLSASGIVKLLGKASTSGSQANDPDAVAGAAMLDAMKAFGNANTGTSSASATPQKAENHGWSTIHADIRERRGR